MQLRLNGTALIALLLSAGAIAQSPDLPGDIEVTLLQQDQSRLGITILRLEESQAADVVEGVARVLDAAGLALLEAEIESATAAAEASASAAKRLELLSADDENASLQSLEVARAQARADASRLRLARRRVALEWSAELAKRDDAFRRSVIDQVAAGDAALLRVDPLQSGAAISGAVRLKSGAGLIATEYLGLAATVDSRTQTTGMLVLVRDSAAMALQSGRVLAAEIDSGQQLSGVILPRESLIRFEGNTWAYLRRGADRYIRREVREPRLQQQGWFVSTDFVAGDDIVTAGSGSLLAVERSDEAVEED
jgi:hypothetical protein